MYNVKFNLFLLFAANSPSKTTFETSMSLVKAISIMRSTKVNYCIDYMF